MSVYTEQYVTGTGQPCLVHNETACIPEIGCPIHHPSDHHMRDWPTNWRGDRHMMERICPHSVGHPDPDDLAADDVHGCDGCCTDPRSTR